ncbi:MAG: hypothetical protein CK424_06230 [Legionella sp.]|nr:MAG: hypothetical protein CK424_06230 [Legionella sp.]
MKIDTHTHLFLTKESKPDWKSINFYFDIARMKDLDVVCCTEHLDAIHYSHLLNDLFLNNILGGELLDEGVVRLPNGLIATSGAEVALSGGADVGLHTQLVF